MHVLLICIMSAGTKNVWIRRKNLCTHVLHTGSELTAECCNLQNLAPGPAPVVISNDYDDFDDEAYADILAPSSEEEPYDCKAFQTNHI